MYKMKHFRKSNISLFLMVLLTVTQVLAYPGNCCCANTPEPQPVASACHSDSADVPDSRKTSQPSGSEAAAHCSGTQSSSPATVAIEDQSVTIQNCNIECATDDKTVEALQPLQDRSTASFAILPQRRKAVRQVNAGVAPPALTFAQHSHHIALFLLHRSLII